MTTGPSDLDDSLFSRKQLSERWAVHPETIKRFERRGKLTPLLIGGQVRFRLSEVIRYEAEGEQLAKQKAEKKEIAFRASLSAFKPLPADTGS